MPCLLRGALASLVLGLHRRRPRRARAPRGWAAPAVKQPPKIPPSPMSSKVKEAHINTTHMVCAATCNMYIYM